MDKFSQSEPLPGYEAAATESSKAAIFWFFGTFLYLLFTADPNHGVLAGIGFAFGGMFVVSIFVAMPLFLASLSIEARKPPLGVWFFRLTCAPATIAVTWYGYHWLFQ